MLSFEQKLEKYAEVIIKVGVNIQPGQKVLILSALTMSPGVPLELAPLINVLVKKAYQNGAKLVSVIWADTQNTISRFQHAPKDSFEEYPIWAMETAMKYLNEGDAFIAIHAENPDLLNGQDSQSVSIAQQAMMSHLHPVFDLITKNVSNWILIAAPVEGWYDKIFPNVSPEKRKKRLWNEIFELCRITTDDPISGWQQHLAQLKNKSDYLNSKRYASLKFTAPSTNLTIGLPEDHIWQSGSITSKNGIKCTVNIPTEEVFTMPHYKKVDGFVTNTIPLFFAGSLVEDFKLTFSEGKVVEATAKKGEEILNFILNMDEGAKRLGEVSLVPHSSPVSKSGLLFYNILYDENASDHLALGSAYRFSIQNGEEMTDEEFAAVGGNFSVIHIDFMIGSKDMNVDGITKDGSEETIMRNGEWAFNL